MDHSYPLDLAAVFQQVGQALEQNRAALNQADPYNANHGDHMVAVFEAARQAAETQRAAGLAEMMDEAARLLKAQTNNGSAQVYARGLQHLAEQFRRHHVSEADLLTYVQKALSDDKSSPPGASASGEALKALVNGLAAWAQDETANDPAGAPDSARFKLNMGALFEFGMAYLQAKQRGGSRVDVLADAAASVSPLSRMPHRYESARLALATLLQAIQSGK